MSSTLRFNITTSIKHTNIYIPVYAPALQIKMHSMQYIQRKEISTIQVFNTRNMLLRCKLKCIACNIYKKGISTIQVHT